MVIRLAKFDDYYVVPCSFTKPKDYIMKLISLCLAALFSVILLSNCKGTPEPAKTASPSPAAKKTEVAEIESPATAGSAERNLSTGSDGHIYLSWIESAN